MKRLLCLLAVFALLLCACDAAPTPPATSAETSSAATSAPTTESVPEPTTASTTEEPAATTAAPQNPYELGDCTVRTYRDENGTIRAMGLAEIINTGDTPLYLDYGVFELRDGAGALVMTADAIAAYPQVLLPDEHGYYFEIVAPDLPDTETLTLHVTPDIREAEVDRVRYTVTDTQLRNSPYGGVELTGKVKNETAVDGTLVCIAALFFDENGAPLGVQTVILTETLKADTQTDFTVDSFLLPPELKAEQIKDLQVFAYPLQEQP